MPIRNAWKKWLFIFLICFVGAHLYILHKAASHSAKSELLGTGWEVEMHSLAYYAILRNTCYRYISGCLEHEDNLPFSLLKDIHADKYEEIDSDFGTGWSAIYSQYLFMVAPYNEVTFDVATNKTRVVNILKLLEQIVREDAKSSAPQGLQGSIFYAFSNSFLVLRDHLAGELFYTRRNYYEFLDNMWSLFQKYSPAYKAPLPYQQTLKFETYFGVRNLLSAALRAELDNPDVCESRVRKAYDETSDYYEEYIALAINIIAVRYDMPHSSAQEEVKDSLTKEMQALLAQVCF